MLRSRSSVWAASAKPDEHRAADPPLDEGLDISRRLECGRGGLVRLSPLLAGDRVLDPSGAADQDEAADIEVRAGHDMEGHAGAEGVAEKVTRVRCRSWR